MMRTDSYRRGVRITVTLEDDVAARLNAEARKAGRPFHDVVNECLRRGLARGDGAGSVVRFTVRPCDMGPLRPGTSLDNIEQLVERIDGPERM
jgi:hypothetical protein